MSYLLKLKNIKHKFEKKNNQLNVKKEKKTKENKLTLTQSND